MLYEKNNTGQYINISKNESGQRIDNFLHRYLKGVPKNFIYRIIRKGAVRINKKKIKPEYRLQNGNILRIPDIKLNVSSNKIDSVILNKFKKISNLNKSILYEDDHLLIINKPFGISVHGGSGLSFGIIEGLRAIRPKSNFLELVHRLDKETSGILLIAKKRSALQDLHNQLRLKSVKKEYIALVHGNWNSSIEVIDAPLLKTTIYENKRIVQVNNAGKISETRFYISEKFKFSTLVKVIPITGRTHQIRVHAQYAGHPIAFDTRYGDKYFDEKLIQNRKIDNKLLHRLFLHASRLHFTHPEHRKILRIEAPLDDLLCRYLYYLRS